jgi:hypothetical protein
MSVCVVAVVARVAVLFTAGMFAVYDMDLLGELHLSHVTPASVASHIGRVTDVEWVALPAPIGGSLA